MYGYVVAVYWRGGAIADKGPGAHDVSVLAELLAAYCCGITQGTEGVQSSLSYKIPMGGLIVLPLMMFIGLPFIPESPVCE